MASPTSGAEQTRIPPSLDTVIPVIDISPFLRTLDSDATELSASHEQEKHAVATQWDNAFRTYGFACISGHGVPDEVVASLQTNARSFLAQDQATKNMCCLDASYGMGGYTKQGVESQAKGSGVGSARPDLVESFVFQGNGDKMKEAEQLKQNLPGPFQAAADEYWAHMKRLSLALMKLSAVALGLDEEFFTRSYYNPIQMDLRLAYYPPVVEDGVMPGQMRYGAHTDYQGFTVLKQDDAVTGLQVRLPGCQADDWRDVPPVQGTFVINAGDLIQRWTNGRWHSTWHRVVPPEALVDSATTSSATSQTRVDKSSPPRASTVQRDRLSLVMFTGPRNDATISVLDCCCSPEEPARFPPIVSGEHVAERLRKANMSVDDQSKGEVL